MKLLRGLGKAVGGTVFSLFLVSAVVMMSVVDLTSYENVKSFARGILEDQLSSSVSEADLEQLYDAIVLQCSQVERIGIPVAGIENVSLDCDDVESAGTGGLLNLIFESLFDKIYYMKFDCEFVECVQSGKTENTLVAISDQGNQFYQKLYVYSLIGMLIGLAVLIVSAETWDGRLKAVGFSTVFTALPFLFLTYFKSSLVLNVPPEAEQAVSPILDQLISSLTGKFIVVLTIGIVLVAIGYALGFYLKKRPKRKK